jgi:homoserine O-acetyltransferase/O-succinyltransferase
MNASREFLTVRRIGAETVVRHGILSMAQPLSLHHGGACTDVRIAWRLVGAEHAPVVVVLGGISADAQVCDEGELRGWWSSMAGVDRPIDTRNLRVLSFDYLGGHGQSSRPGSGESFPSVSSYDQANILNKLLDSLEIKSLHAIVGASYGGMVALAFAERYPERVSRLVVISAADRAHPLATAWRSVQRRIVQFALSAGRGSEGLQLARGLAMATYRSAEEFAARFSAAESVLPNGQKVFPVESYLFARGESYAQRYAPEPFLCLSESIDLHRINAQRVCVPVTAVAVREDQLVPLEDMRGLVARLPRGRLHEISSLFGHDAFLKERELLRDIFDRTLQGEQ